MATLHPPERDGHWLRPSATAPAEPRWGHADGLAVGLDPGPWPAPRGLLRVYAPYLDHQRERLVNFVAVEPVPRGASARGLSELEHSALDDTQGKRFWSVDEPGDGTPLDPATPARGVVDEHEGVPRLTVHVQCERFDNGAEVDVRVRFRADRPHEVALAASTRSGSVPLSHCILTATMGNFARLRRVHLADGDVGPGDLWPGFDGPDFAEHVAFPLARLRRDADGTARFAATPDEEDPTVADYAEDTHDHWRYVGRRAVQEWRVADPGPDLVGQVNARATYWASRSPIPGGPSYENLELVEPFREARELVFSVEPLD